MNNDSFFARLTASLPLPSDYFQGITLPPGFALPANLLMFFHDKPAPSPTSHGRYTLVIPRETMIYIVDGRQYPMGQGQALFMRPYQVRNLHPKTVHAPRFLVTFDLTSGIGSAPPNWLPSATLSDFSASSVAAFRAFSGAYLRGDAPVASWSLYRCLRALRGRIVPDSARIPELAAGVFGFINAHLGEPFSLQDVADALRVSESHLRLVFRREMGISLGRYVASQRFIAASHLLEASALSIAEIADRCGFANVYVFSHFFKQRTGLPPLAWRREKKNRDGAEPSRLEQRGV